MADSPKVESKPIDKSDVEPPTIDIDELIDADLDRVAAGHTSHTSSIC